MVARAVRVRESSDQAQRRYHTEIHLPYDDPLSEQQWSTRERIMPDPDIVLVGGAQADAAVLGHAAVWAEGASRVESISAT